MTNEEAKAAFLLEHCPQCETGYCECCEIATAIEALKRNEPQKIKFNKAETYGSPYYCPSCVAEIIKVEFFNPDDSEPAKKVSYCWHCGQALDWEDC